MNVFYVYSGNKFLPQNFCPPVQVTHPYLPSSLPQGPYTYLGHGKQSMVFESGDKKHVLKLFYWKRPLRKKWYTKVENWARFASPMWIIKLAQKKSDMRHVFTRYLWGMEDLPEEIALENVHFVHTLEPLWVSLIAREGKYHALNLASFPFIIQKKVTLLPLYLNAKLQAQDIESAQHAIFKLRDYFIKRIDMGYVDNPIVFEKNYGFLDDQPRQIDIGRLEKKPTADLEQEKTKVLKNLERYLAKHYPMLKLYPQP